MVIRVVISIMLEMPGIIRSQSFVRPMPGIIGGIELIGMAAMKQEVD